MSGFVGRTHSNKIPKIFLRDEDVLLGEKFLNDRVVDPKKCWLPCIQGVAVDKNAGL